jgi:hypothetical protein
MSGILDALARVSLAPPPVAPKGNILVALDAVLRPKREVKVVEVVEPRPDRPLSGDALRDSLRELRAAQPDRAPWPDDWFDRNDPSHGYRCQQMWAEVLRLSLVDVCEDMAKDYARAEGWSGDPKRRPQPRPSWVGSGEFYMVAALAGFDGAAVADRVLRKLASPQGTADLLKAMTAAFRPKTPGARDHD